MSMLLFMPWCPIDKRYEIGDIAILPEERDMAIEDLDDTAQRCVDRITATYKAIDGTPVHKGAVVRCRGKSPTADLDQGEVEVVRELVALVCFSGLARREYFDLLGSYCNSDCFLMYSHQFDNGDHIVLITPRREGRSRDGCSIEKTAITIPVHCHAIHKVCLDESLLDALIAHRAQLRAEDWGKWQSAISCFNQANTDGENVSHQMEWVLLCGAFERLLDADSMAADVASKFTAALVPSEELLARDLQRLSARQHDGGKPLRYEWMREFYRIRGDFAHGKLSTRQPAAWSPLEHLVLATVAFPLVVKCLLSKACRYRLTGDDQAQIDSFERFAETKDFLESPQDSHGDLDSHWKRLADECRWSRALRQALNALPPDLRPSLESDTGDEDA